VIKTLVIKEIDVESDNKKWYSMRIMPYRTSNNLIDGAIIRFNDITQIKLAQDSSFFRTQIEDEIKPIVALISHPVLYIDLNYNVIFSNNAFLNTFLVSESEILNKSLFSIVDGIFNINLFQNLKKQFKSPQKSKIEFNFYTKIQNSYETTYSIVILKNEFDLMYNSPYRLIFRELIRNPLEEQEI